jgi:hypothetical protein
MHVEEALLFFEKDVYLEGRSLLPRNLLKRKVTWRGQAAYILIIWIVAIASWIAIFYQAVPAVGI